jgi:hypothetical protein
MMTALPSMPGDVMAAPKGRIEIATVGAARAGLP